jgi:hypothetical protein
MRDGVVTHSNALALMQSVGLLILSRMGAAGFSPRNPSIFYRMRDGVVTHSNALALMQSVGLLS